MFDLPQSHLDFHIAGRYDNIPAGFLQLVLGDDVVVSPFRFLVLFLQRQGLNVRLRR